MRNVACDNKRCATLENDCSWDRKEKKVCKRIVRGRAVHLEPGIWILSTEPQFVWPTTESPCMGEHSPNISNQGMVSDMHCKNGCRACFLWLLRGKT